jgi:RNA polymerase sigma-70 factor (family 1)
MDYQLLEDKVLLKFLSISDELAFKEIYLRYWKGLYFSAINRINSKEIAEDIIQAVFTALWEKREKHNIQNLSGYLQTAVKYQMINYIKSAISKRSHLSIIAEEDKKQENNADLLLLMQELNGAINNALGQLPQKTQTIFRLSRFEQQSNKEISSIMHLSEKAVEYHISQSLKSMRFYLKDFILADLIVLFVFLLF